MVVERGKFLVSLFGVLMASSYGQFLWLNTKFAGDKFGEGMYSAELRWLGVLGSTYSTLHTPTSSNLPPSRYELGRSV